MFKVIQNLEQYSNDFNVNENIIQEIKEVCKTEFIDSSNYDKIKIKISQPKIIDDKYSFNMHTENENDDESITFMILNILVNKNGDYTSEILDDHTSSKQIFSTDINYLINDLTCDGNCNKKFVFEDIIFTDFDNIDFCQNCMDKIRNKNENLISCTVHERVIQKSQSMLNQLNSIIFNNRFTINQPEKPSGY